MTKVLDKLERHKAMCRRRDQWFPLWQELADVLYPTRGGFTSAEGQEPSIEIYDSTPQQARRGLATAIDGLLKPASARWFWLKASDDDLNESEEVKRWFDDVQQRMWAAIYNPGARFIQNTTAVDNDLAAFGLGYLWISENRARTGLMFRALHIGNTAIDENADGQVDTVYITRHWNARQAAQRIGEEKLPPKVREALNSGNEQDRAKMFEFVQAIEPRHDFDPRRGDALSMPFSSCLISVVDQTIVEESGYQEFPVACPRWEVPANQIYPRSPGMMALPDARTLQAMGHTLLVGGQRAVDPPVWVTSDGALSPVRTFPGGLTVVSAEAIRETGGKPLGQLETGANMPIGREMQQDFRAMVEAAFFKNVFNLPVEGPQMTAYEVAERKEEFIRTIGPTLAQLEPDYVGVTIERCFGLLMRASVTPDGKPIPGGPLPPPPEELLGRDVKFEFQSPVQKARKQLEIAGAARMFEFLAPLLQLDATIADNFDTDEIARDMPDVFHTPHRWIRPLEKVQEIRSQRQQAATGAAGIAEGQGVADIVNTFADAGMKATNAQAQQQATAAA